MLKKIITTLMLVSCLTFSYDVFDEYPKARFETFYLFDGDIDSINDFIEFCKQKKIVAMEIESSDNFVFYKVYFVEED